MTGRRHRVTAAALAVLALGVAPPVLGQTQDDLDEVQEEQEEVEGRLDALEGDYAELEAAIAATADRVRRQEAEKRAAEQRLEVARAEVRAAQAAVAAMRAEIVELSAQADEDAVNIYINPDPTLAVMDAADLTTATRREALLATIASSHSDVLDRLNGLEIDLVDAQQRAVAAREAVEAERAAVQARLEEYRATLAEQQRLEGELARRIETVQAEVEALAEEEAGIQAALARASQAPTGPGGSVDLPPSEAGLIWPTSGPVTSPYGQRWGRLHAGIDIGAPSGQAIYASAAGTVISGCGGGYGNCVMIDHGNGMVTLYAHQTSVYVSGGQTVSQGQNIGTIGCTGSCTGPHLHFETRINGSPYDPLTYLP
jgi:murein DD-endopeptidase MepM/ murein hydrolase activator NlpD